MRCGESRGISSAANHPRAAALTHTHARAAIQYTARSSSPIIMKSVNR